MKTLTYRFLILSAFCFCICASAHMRAQAVTQLTKQEPAKSWRKEKLDALARLPTKDLFKAFETAKPEEVASYYNKELSKDMVLSEMIRRGGQECEDFLVAHVKKDSWWNIEVLTALRRIQKKPDPVELVVTGPKEIRAMTRELPKFDLRLKNVDPEIISVHFTFGGDYRSGRQARWSFEVRDASGHLIPPRKWEAIMGGGLFETGPLSFNEKWETTLSMGAYCKLDVPGEYSVRIFYHNNQKLADCDDLTGMICCTSPSFKITVLK